MFRSRESKHVRKMRRFINKIFEEGRYRKIAVMAIVIVVVIGFVLPNITMAVCNEFGCTDDTTPQQEAQTAANGLHPIRAITSWILGFTVAQFIYYVILTPIGWLLGIAGTFADWMLQPAYIINSTVVQVGWGVTRDLANMFFILILLGIALDYILFQSFGVKRALPTLIIVALLINFSLPIAGIFIDFANVFSDFFISKVTGDCIGRASNCGFTSVIAQNLNLTRLYQEGGSTDLIVNMIFATFLMLGMTFTFFALGIMFLLRTGWLYALLILLPLVLVLMPFPKTSSYFGRWTNRFFQWTFFAPVATFFLYLSMLVFQANINPDSANKVVGADAMSYLINGAQAQIWDQGVGGTFIEQVIKYVVVWFFMLGSLMAAQTMGVTGAGAALGMIKSAQKWAGGKVKSAGKKGLSAAGRGVNADERLEKLASGLQKIPGLGMVASGVRGLGAKTKMAMTKQEELSAQKKAELEALPESAWASEQERYEKSHLPGDGARAAHIATMRAKKGKLKVLDPSGEVDVARTEALVRSSYEAAKKHKNKAAMDAILQSNPLVARKINIEEWDMAKRDGETITATDSKTGALTQRNRKTGKTFADVQRDVFDISRVDFANMKGQWNKASVKEFIESGHLNRMHLREAEEISDGNFIGFVKTYYADIDKLSSSDPAKKTAVDKIIKLNPVLTNAYINGNLTDFGLGKPKNSNDWEATTQTSGGNQQQQSRQAGFRPGGMP